ncbi:efflux RND transporter periplasmic adaptor subunit [Sphingobacterium sp. 1.A.5]|uniref:efflux RND transporter periplasmic adaptor subunit n=1 Tax=Sphingobacterium sp. 1.A.5 TaxID=2044604 RepID=UPI000C0BCCC6|nr:efflux RND transporter periplasmic adaptor subunit [Sphingobacterium sp. 1.A.5]
MCSIYNNKLLLFGFGLILSLSACNSDKKTNEQTEEHPENHEHEHPSGPTEKITITSLTQEQINEVGIEFGHIEQKNLTANITANGVLNVPNNNRSNVTPLYGGVIQKLNVQLGDHVRKGQAIATIINPQFIQIQEDYLNANNEIVAAEQELQRQQELNAGNAGVKRNLQNAASNLNVLRTRKAATAKQLQLLGINPNSITSSTLRSALTITSPINGVVSNVYAKLGSYVDVSSPIVEVVDNSMIHLDLQVFERDLPKLKLGQEINFTTTNNPTKVFTAKISRIGASFENESKTIAIHSLVVGDKTGLIDGMNTSGSISVDNVTTSAVPNTAIVEADGKNYIFIETTKQPAEKHENHNHGSDDTQQQQEPGDHEHKDGEEQEHEHDSPAGSKNINFEKFEVIKGVSHLGYTAINPVIEIPSNTRIVIKNAFFINAKMSGTVGHSH